MFEEIFSSPLTQSVIESVISSCASFTGGRLYAFTTSSNRTKSIINSRTAKPSEVKLIREMLCKYVPEDNLAPLKQIQETYSNTPDAYQVIERLRISKSKTQFLEPEGFFIVHKLKKDLTDRLIKGRSTILDLDKNHYFVSKSAPPSGFYVSFAYAKNVEARGYLCEAMMDWIRSFSCGSKKQYLITRPTTKDGVRFCKKHKFEPISSISDIKPFKICYRRVDGISDTSKYLVKELRKKDLYRA